ncbi:MAG TPA: phosphate/phosphite/phosphonate ABC transporter substrate-binding protein [Pseudomonadales bacterium]|nr:phosphate/phosphite/phosphonate ABC transporter substrate-binding protein [Pseudomonadales bacterium]
MNKKSPQRKAFFLAVSVCLVALLQPVVVVAESFVFGVVPQQSARKLAQAWGPILSYLSEKTGDSYSFATATDIPTFEKRLLEGGYDMAYMNPYHYVVFNEASNYKAFAKQSDKNIVGLIVVNKDSQISQLEDLNNLQVAFPSPAAFAASVLPRAELKRRGINIEPRYVSSHDSVYLNVAKGFFPAGGGIGRTLDNFNPELRQNLKVLWKTQGYTPHAFAALPSVSSDAVLRLQKAMLAMHEDEQGLALLTKIGFNGIDAAVDTDWDDIRALELNALDELVQ